MQYQNYKNGLQTIAQKIGDVEQEAEEHKSVYSMNTGFKLLRCWLEVHRDILDLLTDASSLAGSFSKH